MVLDVGRGRYRVEQAGEEGRPADRLELPALAQLLGEGDEVGRLVALVERDHRLEDLAGGLAVEAAGVEDLRRPPDGLLLEQHGAEHRHLGLERLRGNPAAAGRYQSSVST